MKMTLERKIIMYRYFYCGWTFFVLALMVIIKFYTDFYQEIFDIKRSSLTRSFIPFVIVGPFLPALTAFNKERVLRRVLKMQATKRSKKLSKKNTDEMQR